MIYREILFKELVINTGKEYFCHKRILEIGPKDGNDSMRLSSLRPSKLIMIDLPSKKENNLKWLPHVNCDYEYIDDNFLYMSEDKFNSIGFFDLIWCTGVLYHNAEQLRFLRKMYKKLNKNGILVLESATIRSDDHMQDGCFVEIFYPNTYRNTGTITHLPSRMAIQAWLKMSGFSTIIDSKCHDAELAKCRYACICKKENDDFNAYYKNGLDFGYRFGDST